MIFIIINKSEKKYYVSERREIKNGLN